MIDRLRTHGATLLVFAVAIAAFAFLAIDNHDRRSPAVTKDKQLPTIYDCERRPDGQVVVKPNAEPRDFFRMSGCETFSLPPGALGVQQPNAGTNR